MSTNNIGIGTQWIDRNGHSCKVIDIYTKTNTAGATVRIEYVSYHMFLGHRVESIDNHVTIARGIARAKGDPA